MELKDRLKELRRDRGASAGDLARLTGKAESTVRTWESGKSFPDTETLLKLAEHYRVSVDWLLGRVTYESKEQAVEYEQTLNNSTHRGQIERLKKRLVGVCDGHKADAGKSALYMGWFIDTLDECTGLFDRFLSEIDAPANISTQGSYLEIVGAVNKLWADIAFNTTDERRVTKTETGEA